MFEQQIADAGLTAAEVVEGINALYRQRGQRLAQLELTDDGRISLPWYNTKLTNRDEQTIVVWIDDHRKITPAMVRSNDQVYAEPMATEKQLAYIASLIRRGAHEGGGFVGGITENMDLTKLTRRQASDMIRSMTGNY